MIKTSQNAVRVFAPATVANVAIGYDILGFALDRPGDELIARRGSVPGVTITKIHGTSKQLPKDPESNTCTKGVLQLLVDLKRTDECIEIELFKKMPFGSGMGSSAASAAAGVMAVNELLGRPLAKRELAKYAVIGESAADGAFHGDNVIPSLVGGIVLIRDNPSVDFVKLPIPKGLKAFVIYPEIEILTKDARAVLSDTVPLSSMISQTGHAAAFVASLYTSDFELMSRSLKDHVIEPQRARLIPHFRELQEAALHAGALNYTISGAGPSMFGFALNTLIAEQVTSAVQDILQSHGIRSHHFISSINPVGAYKM
ncbi:MAG: homoserine kinase [Bacteroidota bacterium]